MDPLVIDAAGQITDCLKQVVGAMFDRDPQKIKAGLTGLKAAVAKLQSFIAQVEASQGRALAPKTGKVKTVTEAVKPARKSRKKGRFGISEFILTTLGKHADGMRPKDIAMAVSEETGREYKQATGQVGTTLANLRKDKKVVSKGGTYTLAK